MPAKHHLAILILFGAGADAQPSEPTELLKEIASQRQVELINENQLAWARFEYFSKPGTLGVYEFNLDTLETLGPITISPKQGPKIHLISHGLERNPEWRGAFIRWHGEVVDPTTSQRSPLELSVSVQLIDEQGNLRFPDPNRDVALRALENENHTVLEEPYNRPKEKLVYSLAGNFLKVPGSRKTYAFQALDDQLEAIVLYEIDPEKTVTLSDVVLDIDGNVLSGGLDELHPETLRRLANYEAYMEEARRKAVGASVPE